MRQNLQRLAHALRAERCPPQLLQNVQARVGLDETSRWRWPWRRTAFAACTAALLALLAVGTWPNRIFRSPSQSALANRADQVRVAQEAGAALGYIGTLLVDAGKHAQGAILNEAVPPLRNSLEVVSKTIQSKL